MRQSDFPDLREYSQIWKRQWSSSPVVELEVGWGRGLGNKIKKKIIISATLSRSLNLQTWVQGSEAYPSIEFWSLLSMKISCYKFLTTSCYSTASYNLPCFKKLKINLFCSLFKITKTYCLGSHSIKKSLCSWPGRLTSKLCFFQATTLQ